MSYSREAIIHQQVCDFLRYQYPDVIFRTDFAAGIKMTMGQAVRHKRLQGSRAYPDLFIAYPSGKYHGLFIELKREGARVYLETRQLSRDKHIQEQAEMLNRLEDLRYCAKFAVGIDEAVALINWYMEGAHETF